MLQQRTEKWTPQSLRLPRGTAYNPYHHAEALGIQVLVRPIQKANELWMPDYRTIVLKDGMREVYMRTALAHGIAHAELGHADSRPKHEHQADRFAALYLISPAEYAAAIAWAETAEQVAAELGVTQRLLAAYLEWAG